MFDLAGKPLGKVERPGIGTIDGFSGDQDDTETFFTFTSYNTPARMYRYDVISGETQMIRQPDLKFDPDKFTVEQVFYNSKDGTRVPMMLAYRKDLRPTRHSRSRRCSTATADTAFRSRRASTRSTSPGWKWAACWRWPTCAAAASTAKNGTWPARRSRSKTCSTTSSRRPSGSSPKAARRAKSSAIMGGSNGGLLVGAVMVQRPELFGACIPMVGVLDMLRFHQFTAGQFWRDEFGNVENEDEFKALLAYSPYHNMKPAQVPADVDHDGRHGRPRGADAQLQIRARRCSGPKRATRRFCCASKRAPATAAARP